MIEAFRWLRLQVIAASAISLAACGGNEPSAPPTEQPQAVAASPPQVPNVTAGSPETAVHGCVRQVSQALKINPKSVNADCLAGTYSGIDIRGKACTLHVATSSGRFRFVESDRMLSMEAEAASEAGKAVYAIEPSADVEMGQLGLQLSRRAAAKASDVETLVLAAGETSKGARDLASATFSRVKSGDITIVRCLFDT